MVFFHRYGNKETPFLIVFLIFERLHYMFTYLIISLSLKDFLKKNVSEGGCPLKPCIRFNQHLPVRHTSTILQSAANHMQRRLPRGQTRTIILTNYLLQLS